MARYSGRQYKGASRDVKVQKREEAEARNKLTPPKRTKAYRRQLEAETLAVKTKVDARNRSRRGRKSLEVTGV